MPRPTEPAVVRHPEAAIMVALDPSIDYADDDVLVRAYPWAFAVRDAAKLVESVAIEQATAEPGQKRTRSKAK